MKDYIKNLYPYDYDAKAETDEVSDAESHFMIANEGFYGDKRETVKCLSLKSRGNPQRFVNHENQIARIVKWLN